MSEEIEVIPIEVGVEVVEAQERAAYDIQIATANKYPRNLAKVKENCIALVTMDKETAESCRYAVPRDGKTIAGPSVHMARMIAQQFRNLRVDARVKHITDKEIVSEAVCFDLETNYAVKVEVHRSVTKKDGSRFKDDMITVTGNAANAIAFRNAVFNVIPKALTDVCYKAAMQMITGDLSDETKLIKRRNEVIEKMKTAYNVAEDQILSAIGLRSINQVKAEQIADLIAIGQSIKDGDTTAEEVFKIAFDASQEVKAKRNSTEHKTDTKLL